MLKYTLPIIGLLFFYSVSISAQKVEVSAGINQNQYTQGFWYDENPYSYSEFNSGNGYGVYVAIDSLRYEFMVYRFTLGFEQYNGGFNITNGSKVGSANYLGEVTTSKIMLGIYPGNFRIHKLDLNVGVVFGFLVGENTIGTSTTLFVNPPNSEPQELNTVPGGMQKTTADLKLRVAYDIYITENLAISPMLSASYGLIRDFTTQPYVKSFRLFLGIGIERTLAKKQ
jgi:hypothetical protein